MKIIECRALYFAHAHETHAENLRRSVKKAIAVDAIAECEDATISEFGPNAEGQYVSRDPQRFALVTLKGDSPRAAYYVLTGPSFEEIVAMMRDA